MGNANVTDLTFFLPVFKNRNDLINIHKAMYLNNINHLTPKPLLTLLKTLARMAIIRQKLASRPNLITDKHLVIYAHTSGKITYANLTSSIKR